MKQLESVVIRFSGDSGDGMQLTGTQFSNASAMMGNDLATFPDFPSEIRAPQGTIAGVSGFQINMGSTEILTPGDDPDVLVAMNPAALKANLKEVKKGGIIIVSTDCFDERNLKKAGYTTNPLHENDLNGYTVYAADFVALTLEALRSIDLDKKSKARCKNFYALGMTFFMFDRSMESTERWIKNKFASKPAIVEANLAALKGGWYYAEQMEAKITTFEVAPADIESGKYRQINGNTSTAWGLMQAAESAGLPLFLGSYPITPATDILHELAKYKHHGVKTYQAEDEIAGICSSIGAAFGGALSATTTSGPGLALKGEALGLAVMYEIPLVIVNVQRGGPSTGLPTKTEQSDLNQALYGRNGECPMVIMAASRPNDCFHMAYEASRIALEHMTPVLLLTDGYIANGTEPWKIPNPETDYPKIKHKLVSEKDKPVEGEKFLPYSRDEKTLARPWAAPGMAGFEHRVGGLEKEELTGNVCHAPLNHEVMCQIREDKVARVVNNIPLQEVEGEETGDILVVSWGGTYGSTHTAVRELQNQGKKVSLAHIKYIKPFPSNLGSLLKSFKKIIIPELNLGQMRDLLKCEFGCDSIGINKVQGLPFKISELIEKINKELETL